MKKTLSYPTRLLVLLLLLGTWPTGCKKSDDPAAQPGAGCRLASYKSESGSTTSTWQYDAGARLNAYRSGATSGTNYVYDADGFLITATNVNGSGTTTGTNTYEYAAGRLTKRTYKTAAGVVSSTETYEYDGAGNLSRAVVSNVSGSTYTYTFSGGKQSGCINKSSAGAETQPYTFENGLVSRYIAGTYQVNYVHDALGRCTRYEELTSGKVTYYAVYEYTDGLSYNEAQNRQKGHPDVAWRGYNVSGFDVGLTTKSTGYHSPPSGATYKYNESTYTHTKNSGGFPLESNWVYRAFNATGGVTSTQAGKYTYAYAGCN